MTNPPDPSPGGDDPGQPRPGGPHEPPEVQPSPYGAPGGGPDPERARPGRQQPHPGEPYAPPGDPRNPQWQQGPAQPGGGPPQRNTAKIAVIVVAVAVVLAGAGVGIAAAMGAFAGSESKVEDTFDSYVSAVNDGDGAKVMKMTCAADREFAEEQMDAMGITVEEAFAAGEGDPTLSAKVTDVTIDGDSATITFDGITDWGDGDVDTDEDLTMDLVKEDGDWKIC